jgi:hypothetical protein
MATKDLSTQMLKYIYTKQWSFMHEFAYRMSTKASHGSFNIPFRLFIYGSLNVGKFEIEKFIVYFSDSHKIWCITPQTIIWGIFWRCVMKWKVALKFEWPIKCMIESFHEVECWQLSFVSKSYWVGRVTSLII